MKNFKNMTKKAKVITTVAIAVVLISGASIGLYAQDINSKVNLTLIEYHSIQENNTKKYNADELETYNTLIEKKEELFNALDYNGLSLLNLELIELHKNVTDRIKYQDEMLEKVEPYASFDNEMTVEEQSALQKMLDDFYILIGKVDKESKDKTNKKLEEIKKKFAEIAENKKNRKEQAQREAETQSQSSQDYYYEDDDDYYSPPTSSGGSGGSGGSGSGNDTPPSWSNPGQGGGCDGAGCSDGWTGWS